MPKSTCLLVTTSCSLRDTWLPTAAVPYCSASPILLPYEGLWYQRLGYLEPKAVYNGKKHNKNNARIAHNMQMHAEKLHLEAWKFCAIVRFLSLHSFFQRLNFHNLSLREFLHELQHNTRQSALQNPKRYAKKCCKKISPHCMDAFLSTSFLSIPQNVQQPPYQPSHHQKPFATLQSSPTN